MTERPGKAVLRGGARVKISDVASAAGVHTSTVSRVLRSDRRGRVSPDVAERIRAVAAELGYRPNLIAAGMRTRTTRLVGLIVHDISDPIYPPIVSGIEERLNAAGYMVVIGNTGFEPASEIEMFEQMSARLVDGLILGTTRLTDPVVAGAAEADLPLVSVLRRTRDAQCSAVINDCEGGMRALVDAVLAHGHRDIAMIAAPQTLSTAQERHDGLVGQLRRHGVALPDDRQIIVPRMTQEHGRLATLELLDRRPAPPSAIMAVNDLVAVGAIQACRMRGLRCPGDVSITGYNGMPLLDMLDPPLTTVAMRMHEIGARSAELLMEHLATPDMPHRIERIAPELQIRASLARR